MMVDDEPIMLDIVQALLEEEGYRHFITVQDSTQAVDKLLESNPDILLLDLDMPRVDGFQVLQAVRALDEYHFLPVLILTAASDPQSKLKALELGATDFLSKPVDPSELALRIRNTLSAKAYQDQLTYYDSLTGLPNRKLFIDRLNWGIGMAKRDDEAIVILDIGLDRFRHINETLGLFTGDIILQVAAERLKKVIRSSDAVGRGDYTKQLENMARIGGDEFSMLLTDVSSIDSAAIICNRVLKVIKEPFSIGGEDLYLTASIGITVYPEDGEDVESLIKHAGAAKEFAKKQGMDNFQFYTSQMNEHSRAIMTMQSDLRKALEHNEFQLYYQPKVHALSGKIMGMELLLRWIHPENGFISPEVFVPVAEDMGLIVPIGEWILNEACHRGAEWVARGYADLKISINVSAQQFLDAGLKGSIIQALKSSGLNPSNLVLEITESMLMGDVEKLAILLNEIKALGVSFSLDDFGTGYSSLSYLKKIPIEELKVDRSFILEVPDNEDDNAIVKAIIAMAHSLGQTVVAEGIETVEQLNFLNEQGCDVIQGYYFSRPLNKVDFSEYLKKSSLDSE